MASKKQQPQLSATEKAIRAREARTREARSGKPAEEPADKK